MPFFSSSDNRGLEPADFSATFKKFRLILTLNNRVIEKIKDMESALAGEYIFDRKYLVESVSELGEYVREIVYSLNAMTADKYVELYDSFQRVLDRLMELAANYSGPFDRSQTLPCRVINVDLENIVGTKSANLGEIGNRLKVRVPRGFAITTNAYFLFMEKSNLFAEIDGLLAAGGPTRENVQAIAEAIARAGIPEEVAGGVEEQLRELAAACGPGVLLAVRSSAAGEDDVQKSSAGQFHSVFQVKPTTDSVLEAYRQVIQSRFSPSALSYLGDEYTSRDLPMSVAVQEMIIAESSGVLYTRNPEDSQKNELLITALEGQPNDLVAGRKNADHYHVSRQHPFNLLRSEIFPKTTSRGKRMKGSMRILPSGLRRGSSAIMPDLMRSLAEISLSLEKAFGGPQDIEWAFDGSPIILQCRPLMLPAKPPPLPGEVRERLSRAELILEGVGQVAQLGVATGRIHRVDQNTDPESFPVGDIAVVRFPSPKLTPIVWRAAAIISAIGGPTGHLATIAREYKTPALFGVGNGIDLLEEGTEITVDVENKQVYRGIIPELVTLDTSGYSSYKSSPELRILRRILHWSATITLTDPSSRDFLPENCATFHDILRFCHEKAVDFLIHYSTKQKDLQRIEPRTLISPVPIKLVLLDLGGGLEPGSRDQKEVDSERIVSRPLKAILTGLFNEDAWNRVMVSPGLKNILTSMSRPISMLTNFPEFTGQNLAILDERYCNLTLRLGYHFNVIDTYFSDNSDENYIYFRFAGGFADADKRNRRALLIASILGGMYFRVNLKDDLVIAKAKNLSPAQMQAILVRLGELIGFTRQLDVQMPDDGDVEILFHRFSDYVISDLEKVGD